MKKDFGKIFGVVLLSLIVVSILYLSLFTYNKKGKEEIKMINIHGNNLLSKEIYTRFADIDQSLVYNNLNLNNIKKRIELIFCLTNRLFGYCCFFEHQWAIFMGI